MPEGDEGQQSRIEQGSAPKYKQETVQYRDGQVVLSITGERGAIFEFDKHTWSPTEPMREGIVTTKSGNHYYIFTNNEGYTYAVNARETIRRGELVAAYAKHYPAQLLPVEFGKPWDIPGFYKTSDVESILLRYKIADPNQTVARKIDEPNPFDRYKSLLSKHGR